MNPLSLTLRCAEIIIKNEQLLELSKTLPEEFQAQIQNLKRDQEIVSQWRWFVTSLGWVDKPNEIVLTAKTYEDLILLRPQKDCIFPQGYSLDKVDFAHYDNQKNFSPFVISEIIAFVNEKFEILFNNDYRNKQFYLYLFSPLIFNYPISEKFSSNKASLVNVTLPFNLRQVVNIVFSPLSTINQNLKSPWSEETYRKFRLFIIYVVNQIALDNIRESDFTTACITPINRIHLAQKAKNIDEIREHLFGAYNGPRFWLNSD
jgi:hypothetical protein